MNRIIIGFDKHIEDFIPKQRGFLLIHDDDVDIYRRRVFDPHQHTLNPLKRLDYKSARQLADVLYTIYPQGENTLTVRSGKRELLKALLSNRHLDKIEANEEIEDMVSDILMSPILRRVLTRDTNFSFTTTRNIHARINRTELGDFDALVLGLVLINHWKGQVVVPDGGFYLRDSHVSLVRDNRLICGVNYLDELPNKLKAAVLSIKDKQPSRVLYNDAVILANFERLLPHTNEYNDRITEMMAPFGFPS